VAVSVWCNRAKCSKQVQEEGCEAIFAVGFHSG
jgi:hypothetical protein